MPVTVSYNPECEGGDESFKFVHGDAFEQWINQNPSHGVLNGKIIEFDEAYVVNELHSTTSRWDPNSEDHATVRLSNAELREQKSWYTLHWRPYGRSTVGELPETEEANDKKREKRRRKKQRQRANKKKKNKKGDPEDDPEDDLEDEDMPV